MSPDTVCEALLDEFRSRPTMRAGSLITTVFGDSIAARGGTIWLGSLINIMAEFGINERLVRTSVYRLMNDGWFESKLKGRKSFYRLTANGRERFRAATHRIYAVPTNEWDGCWCLLILSGLSAGKRDLVRKECGWLGFGALSTNVLAHPLPNEGDMKDTLKRIGVDAQVVIMNAKTVHSDDAMRGLLYESWNLREIDARHMEFVKQFQPALTAFEKSASIRPRTAFIIRTLMIQEYRKVILRDPQLPVELLPEKWHGSAAYRLCRDLYRNICNRADEYLTSTVETTRGPLPPPGGDYRTRFGGLPAAE